MAMVVVAGTPWASAAVPRAVPEPSHLPTLCRIFHKQHPNSQLYPFPRWRCLLGASVEAVRWVGIVHDIEGEATATQPLERGEG